MVQNAFYLVDEEVARRAGVYNVSYVTKDGRFIIDLSDFKRLRLEPDEYLTGITGVERITYEEATVLISENMYRRIADVLKEEEEAVEEESVDKEPVKEQEDDNVQDEPKEEEEE